MISNITARKKETLHRIQIRNIQRFYRVDRGSTASFCFDVLKAIGKSEYALSVAFVSSRRMQSFNERYLQRKYPTDVLSFEYSGTTVDDDPFMGEILISPEVAAKNAKSYHIHPDREIKKLLIHGILHLAGYNHDTDNGNMQRLQKKLMRRSLVKNASAIIKI